MNLGIISSQITMEKTAKPTVYWRTSGWDPLKYYEVRVWNNDTLSADIYFDNGTNPPTTLRGNVASGDYTKWFSIGQVGLPTVVYAMAEATGKEVSDIVIESIF